MTRILGLAVAAVVVSAASWSLPAVAAHGTINGNGWGKCAYDPSHNCGVKPKDTSTETTGSIPESKTRHRR